MEKIDYAKVTAVPVELPGKHKVDDEKIKFKWDFEQKNFDSIVKCLKSGFNDGDWFGNVYFGKFCIDIQFVDESDEHITLLYYKLDPDADYGETSDGEPYDYVGESVIRFKDFPATYEDFKAAAEKIIKCDLEHRFDCTEADIYSDVPMW